MGYVAGFTRRLNELLWRSDASPRWRPAAAGVAALRLVVVIFRAARDPSLNLRAMGLVYSTLLSIAPCSR